jgi:hypothetical protein
MRPARGLELETARSRACPAKYLWSQNVLKSQGVRPKRKRYLFETTFAVYLAPFSAAADMTIETRKPHQDDRDRDERERLRQEKIERERIHQEKVERERLRQEEALDEALKNTFPASDPVSVEQP